MHSASTISSPVDFDDEWISTIRVNNLCFLPHALSRTKRVRPIRYRLVWGQSSSWSVYRTDSDTFPVSLVAVFSNFHYRIVGCSNWMVVGTCVCMWRLNIRCAGLKPITPVAVFRCSNKMSFEFLSADAAFFRILLASLTADSALPVGLAMIRCCVGGVQTPRLWQILWTPNSQIVGHPSVMNNSGMPYLAKWLLNLSMISRDVADESSSISNKIWKLINRHKEMLTTVLEKIGTYYLPWPFRYVSHFHRFSCVSTTS